MKSFKNLVNFYLNEVSPERFQRIIAAFNGTEFLSKVVNLLMQLGEREDLAIMLEKRIEDIKSEKIKVPNIPSLSKMVKNEIKKIHSKIGELSRDISKRSRRQSSNRAISQVDEAEKEIEELKLMIEKLQGLKNRPITQRVIELRNIEKQNIENKMEELETMIDYVSDDDKLQIKLTLALAKKSLNPQVKEFKANPELSPWRRETPGVKRKKTRGSSSSSGGSSSSSGGSSSKENPKEDAERLKQESMGPRPEPGKNIRVKRVINGLNYIIENDLKDNLEKIIKYSSEVIYRSIIRHTGQQYNTGEWDRLVKFLNILSELKEKYNFNYNWEFPSWRVNKNKNDKRFISDYDDVIFEVINNFVKHLSKGTEQDERNEIAQKVIKQFERVGLKPSKHKENY